MKVKNEIMSEAIHLIFVLNVKFCLKKGVKLFPDTQTPPTLIVHISSWTMRVTGDHGYLLQRDMILI